jgi:hypothetical protein
MMPEMFLHLAAFNWRLSQLSFGNPTDNFAPGGRFLISGTYVRLCRIVNRA